MTKSIRKFQTAPKENQKVRYLKIELDRNGEFGYHAKSNVLNTIDFILLGVLDKENNRGYTFETFRYSDSGHIIFLSRGEYREVKKFDFE
tara:strand:+ start:1846 stop:2115 length:270 start_codon:yes stop_codon:yes gene_type:complete